MTLVSRAPSASAAEAPAGTITQDNTFYAYVGPGENLDVNFTALAASINGSPVDVTVDGPGGVTKSCTLPADVTSGTACSWNNLTSSTPGIWRISYDNTGSSQAIPTEWTIDVQNGTTTIPGRVWTDVYLMRQVSTDPGQRFTFYYVSENGAEYAATYYDYNGINSSFTADQIGLHDPGECTSTYQSSLDSEPPTTGGCGAPYKIFFEQPDTGLPATATTWDGGSDWVFPDGPTDPAIQTLTYTWDGSRNQAGKIDYDAGDFVGNLNLRVDANNDGDFTDAQDRVIPLYSDGTLATYQFDGKDGQGNPIPATQDVTFELQITRTDEIHFVNSDVEQRDGGIAVARVRGPGAGDHTLYWDDTHLATVNGTRCSTTPQLDGTAGVNSNQTEGVHGWPLCPAGTRSGQWSLSNTNTGTSGSWGDTARIDDWTYRPVDITKSISSGVPGTLTVTKQVADRVDPSDQFTVSVANSAGTTLGSATTSGTDTSVATDPVPVAQGSTYTITDAMAAGSASALSKYTPTIACTDTTTGDPLPTDGTAPNWTVTVPGTDAYTCAVTNTPAPQPKWTCSAFGYLFQAPNGAAGPFTVTKIDLATGTPSAGGQTTDQVNAVGYNILDDYVYGWDFATHGLARIGSDGSITSLGTPSGLAAADQGADFAVGDVDSSGHYWMVSVRTGNWYEIDFSNPGSPTYAQVIYKGTVTVPATAANYFSDWVFINGALYGVAPAKSRTGSVLLKFDPSTGALTSVGALPQVPFGVYGGQYTDASGFLYASNNATGEIYRVNVATRASIDVGTGPKSGSNDGERCASAPIPTITVTKQVAGRAVSADQFTVSLHDAAGDTLTSATTTGTDASVSTTDWPVSQAATYTITDAMAAGSQTTLSNYTATISCTDSSGATLSTTGDGPSWQFRVPGADAYTCTVTNTPKAPGNPWTCTAFGYLFQSPATGGHQIYQVDLVSGAAPQIGDTPDSVNAVGYNTLDDYIYGWDITTQTLVRVNADGSLTDLGFPANASPAGYNVGDFDDTGHLWLTTSAAGAPWAEIDLAPGSPSYGEVVAHGTLGALPAPVATPGSDWSWINGSLYAVGYSAGRAQAYLTRFDPGAPGWSVVGTVPVPAQAGVGATFTDGTYLYASENDSGLIYRIDPTTRATIRLAQGPSSFGNDGARCASAPIPTITVTKLVAGRVAAGDQFTVSLHNDSGSTLTSASTTGTDTSASTTNWPVSEGATYTITDAMVAGSPSSLSSYDASVSCLDPNGVPVTTDGTAPNWTFTVPAAAAYTCTVTNTPTAPDISVTKSVSPDDGTTVAAGQVLTYTLTFANTGGAAGAVDKVDDLSGVLDDAAVSTDPTASNSALTVSAITDGRFEVTGSVPGNTSYTVSYQVTVRPDGQRGDDDLDNFVLDPGQTTPDTCADGDPTCTHNPVPDIAVSKSVTPDNGSPVVAGQVLTYTITFINTGTAAGPVDYVDDLTKVLDDATVSRQPAAANPPLTAGAVSGGTFEVTGTVPADGQPYTVSYQVTVRPAGQRGDDNLDNFVAKQGTTPPANCAPGDALCTHNPVRHLSIAKRASTTGTPALGDTVGYTIVVTNDGQVDYTSADPPVTDDLTEVLDDGTYIAGSAAATTGTVTVVGTHLSWSGDLAVGAEVTISYSVVYTGNGNAVMHNTACVPQQGQDARCDTVDVPASNLQVSKSVNPDSGTTVHPGQTLDYTLTFDNTRGAGPAVVDYTDYLARVLDDATLTAGPTASNPALTLPPQPGSAIHITGTVPANTSYTVTYQVTVKPDGQRGDDSLGNFLLEAGNPPPTTCDPATTLCTVNPVPEVVASKSVDPTDGATVVAGTVLTYTLSFHNKGQATGTVDYTDHLAGVLDDAAVTTDPAASSTDLTVGAISGGRFAVTGTVPADQTYTVSYQVTVGPDGQRGDDSLDNFLVPAGTTPPASCAVEDPTCTHNPAPDIAVSKSVSPADGATVVAGQQLTYTITFTNSGTATGSVDYTDDLSGVLDDAAVTTDPSASNPDLTVGAITGGQFEVTGAVPPDQTYTVSYRVTVGPDGQRGDNQLDNFVAKNGVQPPASCAGGDPTCTHNPAPDITVSKSVSPADGTAVVAGQPLTYTITFTNNGTAAGAVDYVDYLTKALDDATVTSQPAASDPALTAGAIDNGQFEVTGTVPADGEPYTVSYQVTVLPAGQRGDNQLDNFVAKKGQQPPDSCAPNDTACTHNPVRHLSIVKTASTTDRPAPGASVDYTIVVTNDGQADHAAADGPVTDDLSDVLDDASYVAGSAAATTGTVTVAGDQLSWTGDLAAGDRVTITYSVTYRASGDTIMVNTACVPDQGEDASCDTVQVPAADVQVSKSVDPTSGTTVTAGQTLTYRLTFDNRGQGAGDVDYTDYLAGVLDDATVTEAPAASNPALTVSPVTSGAFRVTGTVPGATSYTVTYQVTVGPDGQRGDNDLVNFVAEGSTPPPATCRTGDPTCTDNKAPDIVASKTVDPASGSAVHAGDVLTYTLTFHNQGQAGGTLDYVDHLGDVLDDATVTKDPRASSTDLTVGAIADGAFPVTGTVPAGATYTVTYQVTVKPDGQRGNDSAGNFLTPSGQTPPQKCASNDPGCTVNPMPELRSWKTVDPASGTTVVPGQTLTYTLHFTNTGQAAGDVDTVDDITQALDDATVASQPAASDPALSVTRFGTDHRAHVTGTLQPGQTGTVSYRLTVHAADQLGDAIVANFLLDPTDPPPSSPNCIPADDQHPACTSNPVGSLQVSKSVDPKNFSDVHPGDTLTYRLTFHNVGTGPAPVDYLDHLDAVLDDATVTSDPRASSNSLTVSAIKDGAFTITGSVPAGETVTITYQVKTKAYDEQGDHDLVNFLDPTGVTPPASCGGDNPLCTTNPVPPPAAPAGGSAGGLPFTGNNTAGQLLLAGILVGLGGLLVLAAVRRRRRSN